MDTPEGVQVRVDAMCDALADFQAACERTVAGGACTLCEADSPELIPWSGERICVGCMDTQLDLLALAIRDEFELLVTGAAA